MRAAVEDETSRRKALCEHSRDSYTAKFPEVPIISAADALQQIETIILVDVRPAGEREVGMIKGAISQEEFESSFPTAKSLPEGTVVAAYCTIGYRSGQYTRSLVKEKGFPATKVFNHEGILMHTYLRQPLVEENGNEQPSPEVHTFASPWSGLADPTFKVQYTGALEVTRNICSLS